MEDYATRAYKMGKQSKGEDSVVARFKDCIDDFKQILPLVEELANPALKVRWPLRGILDIARTLIFDIEGTCVLHQ